VPRPDCLHLGPRTVSVVTFGQVESDTFAASLPAMPVHAPLIVFVAGYGNSGPGHWQRRWHESRPGSLWVEQDDWDRPECTAWIAGIERAVAARPGPVFFVTHSLGGLAVAAWSRTSAHAVAGALLVAVPDPDQADFPRAIRGFGSPDMNPLRFPALMVASSNDPYITAARSATIAAAWGASLADIGPHGHINAASSLGDWPDGQALLDRAQREAIGA
jgi:uncharacterized protein